VTELRVGLDTSPLVQTGAGTARYVRGLLEAMPPGIEIRRYTFGGPGRVAVPLRDVGWYLAGLPARAARDRIDVLHCPSFRAPVRSRVPVVLTAHDLAVLRHPYLFNRWSRRYGHALLPRVLREATRIIAVSEFTRKELLDAVDLPGERVRVVHNGVGPPFEPDGHAAPGQYVLAVSTLEPRKNLNRLIEGFSHAGLPGHELLVAGAAGWGDVQVAADSVRWLGAAPDDELARLYRGAACVAYLSLYEGFGLPVLEAMRCGAPVVISQAEALAEVAGNAAVTVDALDPSSIAAGLHEAIERRDELRALGVERAALFSWERTARETVSVYQDALG
jgi:glycosyltransferase involved in cell wall biosynthesis